MPEPEEQNTHEELVAADNKPLSFKEKKKHVWWRKAIRVTIRSVLMILFLFLLLAFIVQLPPVQNWAIQKTTAILTKELNTTVKIGSFSLNFFDEVTLKNVFIANQNTDKDTLLNVGSLRVDINYPYLLFGIIQLDGIRLENATVRLKRSVGQCDFNHQFILDYFDPPKEGPPSPKKATDIRIGQIHLRNIDFIKEDSIGGERMTARLTALDMHTNIMNLPKHLLDITRVNVYNPYFHLEQIGKNPLLPKVNKVQDTTRTPPQYLADKKEEDKPFRFQIGAISIENAHFLLDNWRNAPKRKLPDSLLEYSHLNVSDININIHNFILFKEEFTGVVDGISLKEKSGFVLNKLVVGDAKVSPTETALYGLQIETPNTLVGDTLRFIYPSGYEAFNDFENKVTLDAHINRGKVLMDDIMTFAVGLENNPFFVRNRREIATIDARAFGKINSLKLPNFDIGLGKGFHAEGKFDSKDLTNSDETYIKLDLNALETNISTLKQLIPNFKPPTEFDRLGNLTFKGAFVGFFNDFTANGRLNTDIGAAIMDVKLVPATDNKAVSTYSGDLALDNFNLGAFTQNVDLGKISMKTTIVNGVGFNKDNVNLKLIAVVDNFQVKGYDYKGISITGDLNKNLFKGKLESKDENAKLLFDGTVDMAGVSPVFKFQSAIDKIDLKTLNLSKDDIVISGKLGLDLSGSKLSDFTGRIEATNVVLLKDKTQEHRIDSLSIISSYMADSSKHLEIHSEIVDAQLEGTFNIDEIPDAFLSQFQRNHPRLSADLGIAPKHPLSMPHNFTFNFNLKNSKTLNQLFAPKLQPLKNIVLTGDLRDSTNSMKWELETLETHNYDNVKIVEFAFKGEAKDDHVYWGLGSYNVLINGQQDFKDLIFQNEIIGESLQFGFTSHNFSEALKMDTVELNAVLIQQDSFYKLSFGTSQLSRIKIFGNYWDVDSSNFIVFGKNHLDIRGFDLRHKDQQITLESCETAQGLSATLNNFDLAFLNPYIKDPRFKLGGKYYANIEFDDIFNQKNFRVHASMDSLIVKGENRGAFRIAAMGKDFKTPIYADISLLKSHEKMAIEGYYYPEAKDTFAANSLDLKVGIKDFPIKTLNLLIEDGVSRWVGNVEGGLHVSGPVNALNYNGSARLRDVALTIDYVQTRLYVRDETVKITTNLIDATGCSVYDSLGHQARVYGGLTHKRFEDIAMNVRVLADTFLMLNTKREGNPLYYGYAIGKGAIVFTGDFSRTNISIKATTGKGTKIVFPFASDQKAAEKEFVVFKTYKNREGSIDSSLNKVKELSGINLDMDLTMTDQAETTLIFDENAGDNIKSRGNGNVFLSVNRNGEMKMTGEYRIEKGDYLFTLAKLINKNFALKRGGTIRWNGNPFDALIDIDAEYKDLSTAPFNFIAEYVDKDKNIEQESRKPTPVDLSLKLSGALMKPNIDYDLAFPRLTSDLKTYTENKLRLLRQDQNELNKQVFGLVVLGGFLPSDVGSSQLFSGSINTLTETVSSAVSNMFNKFVGEYITGLDVQIGYNIYEFDRTNLRTGSQQFRLRGSYDINDKWSVSGGVGVESNNTLQAGNNNSNVFVGGDVLFDYTITKDRRMKLRISNTYDQVLEGKRNKTAAGLRFRQEFDSFEELMEIWKIRKKVLKTEKSTNGQ
jgi:TamB, inner membrane protein subunit of TAM complex